MITIQENTDALVNAFNNKDVTAAQNEVTFAKEVLEIAQSALTKAHWAIFRHVMAWVGIVVMAAATPALMMLGLLVAAPFMILSTFLASVLAIASISGPPLLLAFLISRVLKMEDTGLTEAKKNVETAHDNLVRAKFIELCLRPEDSEQGPEVQA
jgi:hypothetical protein